MKTVEIIEKEYLPEQKKLLYIFKQHAAGVMPEIPIVFKAPNIKNKVRTHINRIPCKTVGKRDGYMLVAMEVVDFIRLMIKSGIEVQIYESN